MTTSAAFDDHLTLVRESKDVLVPQLEAAAALLARSLASGGTCLAFGNGGSASDAQHFVAELVGHFSSSRRPYSAVALTTDPSVMTSVANDLGFDQVFARQVAALGRAGDVVLAISTSGRSPNVVAGAAVARSVGCAVIGLTAGGGGELAGLCDLVVDVPSVDTQRIQEVHALCLHTLVAELERLLGDGDDDV